MSIGNSINNTLASPIFTGTPTMGTLGYSAANALTTLQSSVNAYNQFIIRNSNAGAAASSDFVVNNDQSTDTTFYGDFGMNSSAFSGTGALNAVNNIFLTSTSADLAIGTTTSHGIHFVVNSGATDAMTISSAGVVTIVTASPVMTTPNITTGFTIGGAAASGKFIVGNGTNYIASTSTIPTSAGATAGKILVSDGTNYVLSTPTFPNASATTRKKIVSDGTNWIASTETWAVPGTSGNILQSDGTNWTSTTNTGGWTTLKVAGSNYTNATTSLTDVTGLVSATLSTATLYEFEAVLYVNSSSTAGMQVAVQQTGTGSGQIGVWSGTATNAAATGLAIGSNALNTAGAACVLVNGDGQITMKGFIKTGSSGSPTILIRALKTTSGTATILIGSTMRFRVA